MAKQFTTKKYEGDDLYSWAVFKKGRTYPVATGLSRSEAKYYRDKFEKEAVAPKKEKIEERQKKGATDG